MKRTFCFTCAAVASAEAAPAMVWTSADAWGRSDICVRCGKKKIVMDYDLTPAKEVRNAEGSEEA